MRRHAKASSAGSSTRQGSRLGRIIRGAVATRGAFVSPDRSGAPSHGRTRVGNRPRLVVLALAVAAISLALGVSLAGASKGVVTYFGSAGEGDGQFGSFASGTTDVAINKTGSGSGAGQGDVYVLDTANRRVEQFTQNGAFVRAFGWGVNDGADAFQVCTSGCQAAVTPSVAGSGGALPNPQGIAVDQATGNVFVLDRNDSRVNVYGSDGAFQGAFGWNVDSSGGSGEVEFCTASCQTATVIGAAAGQMGAAPIALAVDPTDGGVYVADRSNKRVNHYDVTTTAGAVTAAAFSDAFGWDVDTGGVAGAFETCTATCRAGQGTAAGIGQFNTNQPADVAVDSTGAVYAVESVASSTNKRRVHKFVPGGGTYTPSEFATAILSSTGGTSGENNATAPLNVAIGASDRVFVVKATPAGATPSCPNGAASAAERRVLEVSSDGATLLDTHMACAGIGAVNGLSVNPTSGRVFLPSTVGDNRVYVLDDLTAPSAAIDPVSGQTATTATFKGHVDPMGSSTGYRFEYSADGGATWTRTAEPDIDLGTASSNVSKYVAGLSPNTAYQARLIAAKPFGGPVATAGPVSFTTDAAPPSISTSPSFASTTTAGLRGLVNPQSSAVTDCHFEWGPTTAYGNEAPCETLPGSGGVPVLVGANLEGLAEGATYHFRLFATNSAGTSEGVDLQVTVGGALPDDRAYEMVSPVDKNGGEIMTDTNRIRTAQTELPGLPMAVMFSSIVGFADTGSSVNSADYVAQRTLVPGTQGWSTHSVTPPQDPLTLIDNANGQDPLYLDDASPDLTGAVFRSGTPALTLAPNVAELPSLYFRSDLRNAGAYSLLSDAAAPQVKAGSAPAFLPRLVGASFDAGAFLFESSYPLSADAPADTTEPKLYLSGGGVPIYVGHVPAGAATECEGATCVPAPRAIAGQGGGTSGHVFYTPHVLSADGERAIFTLPALGSEVKGKLYLRDTRGTGSIADDTTVQLNVSEASSSDAPQPASYWDASLEGDRIFFTSQEKLTDDASGGAQKLYMWSAVPDGTGHHLTFISADENNVDPIAAVQGTGAIGVSADGTVIYFLQRGQIVAGQPPLGQGIGIYAWQQGHGVSYLGQMLDNLADVGSDVGGVNHNFALTLTQQFGAHLTSDGSRLLLSLRQPPFPGGDHGDCPQDGGLVMKDGRQGCRELYLYDLADPSRPVCASCSPAGTLPTSPAFYQFRTGTSNASTTSHLNQPFSADGRYVFFTSGEALLPQDTNGVKDAYEYDSATGQLHLLSSGTEESDSYFIEAIPDGHDVFIATRQRLTGWDVDQAYDLYDVRVDGGVPDPSAVPAACQGESCQSPAATAPGVGSVASSMLTGPVNAKPRRCAKGKKPRKVRGKVRCVKPRKHHRTANTDRRASR